MTDDELDLSAWKVPAPPASLVDGVMARVSAVPAVEPAPVRKQEVSMATKLRYGAIGAAVAAAAVIAVYQVKGASSSKEPEHGTPARVVEHREGSNATSDNAIQAQQKRDVPTAPRRFTSPEQRTAMLDDLAVAKAQRVLQNRVGGLNAAAGGAAQAIAAGLDPDEVRASVKEVLPLMAECFDLSNPATAHIEGELVAKLAIQSEPDVGTIIADADLSEGDAVLVDNAELTECLHETLMSLELPPLPSGGEATIDYPFAFSTGDPDSEQQPEPKQKPAPKQQAPRSEPAAVAPTRTVQQLVDDAQDASRQGKYAEALRDSEEALRGEPGNAQALTTAAIAACNLKDPGKAKRYLGKLSGARQAMIVQVCKRNGIDPGL